MKSKSVQQTLEVEILNCKKNGILHLQIPLAEGTLQGVSLEEICLNLNLFETYPTPPAAVC